MRLLRAMAMTSAAVIALTSGPIGTVEADVTAFSDRRHDAKRTLDVERVRVDHGKRIVVTVTFRDLRRTNHAQMHVYFDTRSGDRGPEYRAEGDLGVSRSWAALRVENWQVRRAIWLAECDIDMRVSYRHDRASFDVARQCFRRPDRTRVAVYTLDWKTSQHDYAPERHRFYDWVRQG